MTINDRIVSTIRTLVPALYGVAIAALIRQVPAVGDALAWLSAELGQDVALAIGGILTALVIAGYYWVARKVGDRYPAVEKWLLGSSLTPVYSPQIIADPETGDVALVSRSEYRQYLQARVDDVDGSV